MVKREHHIILIEYLLCCRWGNTDGAVDICNSLQNTTAPYTCDNLTIFSCPLSPDNNILWCTALQDHHTVYITGTLPAHGKAWVTYIACYL